MVKCNDCKYFGDEKYFGNEWAKCHCQNNIAYMMWVASDSHNSCKWFKQKEEVNE